MLVVLQGKNSALLIVRCKVCVRGYFEPLRDRRRTLCGLLERFQHSRSLDIQDNGFHILQVHSFSCDGLDVLQSGCCILHCDPFAATEA